MAKTKDLSPSMHIPTAETELALPFGTTAMAQSSGGLSLFSNAFRRGAGNKIFGNDENGLWLGAADYPSAPFRVDYNGHVVANSADFSGAGYTKLTIFKQDAIPTSVAVGDLWFDTDDGNKMYRAGSVGADQIASGEWELVASTTISIFAQDSIPTSLAIGDLWYDTNDSNKVYRAASVGADQITAGEWVAVDDQRAADAILKGGTSQTLTGDIDVGGSTVKIDGVNGRITITISAVPAIVIGNV